MYVCACVCACVCARVRVCVCLHIVISDELDDTCTTLIVL